MKYEWSSSQLICNLLAERVAPLTSSSGEEIFNLKSLMDELPDLRGLGKSEAKAKKDFEDQVYEKCPELRK